MINTERDGAAESELGTFARSYMKASPITIDMVSSTGDDLGTIPRVYSINPDLWLT